MFPADTVTLCIMATSNNGDDIAGAEAGSSRCDGMVQASLQNNTVKFMLEKLQNLGCKVPEKFIRCAPCGGAEMIGHFDTNDDLKVVVCEDILEKYADTLGQRHVDRTIIHELVHAYDHCRAKVDWLNCYHHACSEVRAAHLSGTATSRRSFQGAILVSKVRAKNAYAGAPSFL